jgi:hypothetical protein
MLIPIGVVCAGFHSSAEVVTLDMTTGAAIAAMGNEADAWPASM